MHYYTNKRVDLSIIILHSFNLFPSLYAITFRCFIIFVTEFKAINNALNIRGR